MSSSSYPGLRTGLLFVAIIALFVAVGAVAGEFVFGSFLGGLVVALGLSLVFNLAAYFFCDRFVLWSSGAKIVRREEAPRLARIVDELAPMFGLVAPRIAIVPTMTPNAFATGRNAKHAVVAATEGILHLLDDRELRGVLAHELAHVKDRDVLLMTFAATLAGAISYFAQFAFFAALTGGSGGRNNDGLGALLAVIPAAIAAMLIQLAISRSRESKADIVGATTIGDPLSLASALAKLEQGNAARPLTSGSPAMSSLYIVNPFRGRSLMGWFSTHPPTEERIRALRALAADRTYRPPIRAPSVTRPGFSGRSQQT
ncbi:MAG: M48 family metalloprotease [Thermoplasmata archaeon]|nr:M48 family metalloprotease [Thermoplasmata archaeon]MCI4355530.1 M48 family metalloprotease [Thermoplasmata archaeon]